MNVKPFLSKSFVFIKETYKDFVWVWKDYPNVLIISFVAFLIALLV